METQRFVLDSVHKVGSFEGGSRPPEDDPAPACIGAILELLGDDLGLGAGASDSERWHTVHVFLMVTTGAAFRMDWRRGAWGFENMSLATGVPDLRGANAEGCRSAGLTCEVVLKKRFSDRHGLEPNPEPMEQEIREQICQSLATRHLPVMAFGLAGPPEAALVCGFDDGGKSLIGCSFFQKEEPWKDQIELEPNGMFRKADWF